MWRQKQDDDMSCNHPALWGRIIQHEDHVHAARPGVLIAVEIQKKVSFIFSRFIAIEKNMDLKQWFGPAKSPVVFFHLTVTKVHHERVKHFFFIT